VLRKWLICGALLACGPGLALAQQRAPADSCQGLEVAFYEHGALYYRDQNGAWAGVDKDLIDELEKRLSCRFVRRTDSRVRIWTGIASGTLDITVSGIPSPEREKAARFIPYLWGHNYVLLQMDAKPQVQSLETFLTESNYKVAVIRSFHHGATYDARLDKLRAQGRVYETGDFSSLLRLFKLHRVDAVLGLPTSWGPLLRHEEMTGQYRIMDWAPQDNITGGLVVSRTRVSDALAAQFSRAIHDMQQDGTLRAIYERHLGPELTALMLK